MLQMTIAPGTAPPLAPAPPSMADALPIIDALEAAGDLQATTALAYKRSVRRLQELVQTPLAGIPCTEAWIEARFPHGTLDPDMFPSAPAQDQYRRRLLAVARHVSGEIAAARARRGRVDDWAALRDALEANWDGLVAAGVVGANNASKNVLIPLGTLADCARREGLGVRPLTGSALVALAEDRDTAQRESFARAAALLDAARVVPDLADLLPAAPLDYKPAPRRPADRPLPGAFEAEVAGWVHAATHFGWDELDEEYEDELDPEGGTSAFRTYIREALNTGALATEAPSALPIFADSETAKVVCRALKARIGRLRAEGGLAARTVAKYLKTIARYLERAGVDANHIEKHAKTNRVLKRGARDDASMTPKNRRFCELLLQRQDLQVKFLGGHLMVRRAAEEILARAAAAGRSLTGREAGAVRALGVVAAFMAIEVGGAPLRVENALEAPLYGPDAWITLPRKTGGPLKVCVPYEYTKNGKARIQESGEPIKFTMRAKTRLQAYETVMWYIKGVRSLFRDHKTNMHLFPGVSGGAGELAYETFLRWYKRITRDVVGLPMTPHQQRHGQASLLINKFPERKATIARRLGNSEAALLRYYGWIDTMRAMIAGQNMMVELCDA